MRWRVTRTSSATNGPAAQPERDQLARWLRGVPADGAGHRPRHRRPARARRPRAAGGRRHRAGPARKPASQQTGRTPTAAAIALQPNTARAEGAANVAAPRPPHPRRSHRCLPMMTGAPGAQESLPPAQLAQQRQRGVPQDHRAPDPFLVFLFDPRLDRPRQRGLRQAPDAPGPAVQRGRVRPGRGDFLHRLLPVRGAEQPAAGEGRRAQDAWRASPSSGAWPRWR